jgi:hypothetical protein
VRQRQENNESCYPDCIHQCRWARHEHNPRVPKRYDEIAQGSDGAKDTCPRLR